MYCRKCGRKIEPGTGKCRKCGEPADTAEICGGFWGLVESGAGLEESQQGFLKNEEELRKKEDRIRLLQGRQEQQRQEAQTWKKAFLGAAAAAVVLGIAFLVSVVFRPGKKPVEQPGPETPPAVAVQTDVTSDSTQEAAATSGSTQDQTVADADTAGMTGEAAVEAGEETAPEGQTGASDSAPAPGPETEGKPSEEGYSTVIRRAGKDATAFETIDYIAGRDLIHTVKDRRGDDRIVLDGTIEFRNSAGQEVPCGDGYSRIDYDTDPEENGSITWTRTLKVKEKESSRIAADRYGTAIITDKRAVQQDPDTYVVYETYETEDGRPNTIRKDWMPAYDQIRYTYQYISEDDEYRLVSAEYFEGTRRPKKEDRPVFAVDYKYRPEKDEKGVGYLFTGRIREEGLASADFLKDLPFDEIRIRYGFQSLEDAKDKYRLQELSFRKDEKAAAGPDGFAVMTCSYDEETGDRTEQYYMDKERTEPALVRGDAMLTWENAWLLYSQDFDLHFFMPGRGVTEPESAEDADL
ncbi:MAG: zinc ribbon domain-containing protein [Eubacteriales bacterium]|nr:zinc ribbon domain-containing protein [Eubacteriales bacterium]